MDVTSKTLNKILFNEDAKPSLDSKGRVKVARWGSDNENEAGTIVAQRRKLPNKRPVYKPASKK